MNMSLSGAVMANVRLFKFARSEGAVGPALAIAHQHQQELVSYLA